MRTGSLVRVPHSGTANWTSDRPSASAKAKCPASVSTSAPSSLGLLLRGRGALPMALLFQGIGNLARHVGLVVAGQHGVGLEHARGVQHAFRHDPLTLAEEVRQDAHVTDWKGAARIHHLERDGLALALDRAFLDEAAEAK